MRLSVGPARALVLLLATSCTPMVVPVNVAPPQLASRAVRPLQIEVTDLDKARITRGAPENTISTRWPIDASKAIEQALRSAVSSASADASAGRITVRLRDFDVDWTAKKGFGISPIEVTLTSIVQMEYELNAPSTARGVVVGRGRLIKTGAGARIDQKMGEFINTVASEAIGSAVLELVRDIDRQQPK